MGDLNSDTLKHPPTPMVEPSLPLSYRAQLIQKAFPRVPTTAEGLPVGLYRIDLLPAQATSSDEETQALHNAYLDLSYEHGYPTLSDGRPYWNKLDFEPSFAYGIFQIYLEQIEAGPRELHTLAENKEIHMLASRMQGLPEGQLLPTASLTRLILEFSILYYWRTRAKANDLYKEASYRHLRLRRQMNMENKHYEMSEKLLNKLQTEVFGGKEFWDNMSPKTAVEFLGKLVGISRISTGLPMSGPLSAKETPEDQTFEMILRTLGQRANQGNTYDNGTSSGGREILDGVLNNKESAGQLQELIIKVTKARHEALPNPHATSANRFKGRARTEHAITSDDLSTGLDMEGVPGANLDTTDAEIVSDQSQSQSSARK